MKSRKSFLLSSMQALLYCVIKFVLFLCVVLFDSYCNNNVILTGDGNVTEIELESEGESLCGNGIVEGEEECDDGNNVDGDGCNNDCFFSCKVTTQDINCNDGFECTEDICLESTHTCFNPITPADLVCRPSTMGCDPPEFCTGQVPDCPPDVNNCCTPWKKIGEDIRVTDAELNSLNPVVRWTGSQFGLVWQDARDSNWEIYFAKINFDGTKDGQDIRITEDGSTSQNPSLVWTGSLFALAWEDNRDGNMEVYFTRIGDEGVKMDQDIRITFEQGDSANPSMTWTGSQFAVVWEDSRDGNPEIYFTLLEQDGTKVADDIKVTNSYSEGAMNPSIVWTGSEFGVAWEDSRNGNMQIYFGRLYPDGEKVAEELRVTNTNRWCHNPFILWTEGEFTGEFSIVWEDAREGRWQIFFARIRADGVKIGEDVLLTDYSISSLNPGMVWTGSQIGITWSNQNQNVQEIYFAILNRNGTKEIEDINIANEHCDFENPSIAWNGSFFSVAWQGNVGFNSEIYMTFIGCSPDH